MPFSCFRRQFFDAPMPLASFSSFSAAASRRFHSFDFHISCQPLRHSRLFSVFMPPFSFRPRRFRLPPDCRLRRYRRYFHFFDIFDFRRHFAALLAADCLIFTMIAAHIFTRFFAMPIFFAYFLR